MPEVGEIVARLRADTSDFKGGLNEAEKHTQSFAQKMDGFGKTLQGVGTKMTIGLTAPLVLLGKQAFDAASDLNESLSKANVVFAENAKQILKWSETSATAMGISRQEALESAATFGNLFRALGVGLPAATDMSMALVQLASDLASFNNADPSEVLLALRAGLVGEAEPLRKFGVSLSAARIESEALSSGLVKATGDFEEITRAQIGVEKATIAVAKATKEHGAESLEARTATSALAKAEEVLSKATKGNVAELTAAQKTQAAYQIIMKDTALAQGDFSRTSGDAAGQQRILKAQLQDTLATLGQELIPIFQMVAGVLKDVMGWFSGLDEETQKYIVIAGLVVAALGPVIGAFGTVIRVFGALSTLMAANPYLLLLAASAALAIAIVTNWDTIGKGIEDVYYNVIVPVINKFVDAINQIINDWNSLFGWLGLGIGKIDKIVRDTESDIDRIYRKYGSYAAAVADPGGFVGPPPIWPDEMGPPYPGRAHGGPVMGGHPYWVGERGPEMFVPGQSGTVVPNGSGGSPVVIELRLDRHVLTRVMREDLVYIQSHSGNAGIN